jgi:hypothetical protein
MFLLRMACAQDVETTLDMGHGAEEQRAVDADEAQLRALRDLRLAGEGALG